MSSERLTKVDRRVLETMRKCDRPAPWSMTMVANECGMCLGSIQHVVRRGRVFDRGADYGNCMTLRLKPEFQEVSATC